MSKLKIGWRQKVSLASGKIFWLLRQWRYTALALVAAGAFFELIYWLFNLQIFTKILTSSKVGFLDKLELLIVPFRSIGVASGRFSLILMILLAIIQGITIAGLVYVVKNQPKVDAKLFGSSTITSLLAVVGLGCPACGTSVLTPIVALFVSGSTLAISETITEIALPLAILVGLYGLQTIGLRIATVKAHQDLA